MSLALLLIASSKKALSLWIKITLQRTSAIDLWRETYHMTKTSARLFYLFGSLSCFSSLYLEQEKVTIFDQTEVNLVAFRRTIYLAIQSRWVCNVYGASCDPVILCLSRMGAALKATRNSVCKGLFWKTTYIWDPMCKRWGCFLRPKPLRASACKLN